MPFFAATSTTEREKMRRTFVRSFFPFEVRQLYSKQRWWYLRLLTFSPLRVLRAGVKGNIYLVSRPRQIFAINLRSHVTIARKKRQILRHMMSPMHLNRRSKIERRSSSSSQIVGLFVPKMGYFLLDLISCPFLRENSKLLGRVLRWK